MTITCTIAMTRNWIARSVASSIMGAVIGTACIAQSPSEKASVQLFGMVQVSPARITVNWTAYTGASSYAIYRKLHTATSWGSLFATVAPPATSYADNTAAINTLYEYKVVRTAADGTGYGYLCAGIEVPATEYLGKIVLLVDNALTSSLTSELQQLQNDLKADGWAVIRHDVATGTAVTAVRNLVIADYNADPTNVKAVYIVGHVPVPYSGDVAPDGHTAQHKGAWPCDGYYAEVTGTWTDNMVNNTTGWLNNQNVPGDGKFDQSDFPNTVELQVGRVDMHDLPAFTSTEAQLLSTYLTKAHNFKIKNFTPTTRGIIWDHLADSPLPEAASSWMSMPTLVGPANITAIPFTGTTWLEDLVNNQSYLWTYGSGGGLVGNDNGTLMFYYTDRIAQTSVLAAGSAWGGVFNMTISSYIGDWDNRNNVMRAVLASGKALTNVFCGNPHWWFHPMGMDKSIGYCTRLTMNNRGASTIYLPQSGGDDNPATTVALGLMGDPSLRQIMVAPPTNLAVTSSGGNAAFSWSAATGSPAGYHIYSFDANGVPSRVNASLITGTTFTSTQAYAAGAQYMVRATKVETTNSGSYWNLSLGALATAPTVSTVLASPLMMLAGPYDTNTGLMSDGLRSAGLIPLTEPYTAGGFSQLAGGGGETVAQAVLNTSGSNAIVDWVRVELRSSGAPATVVATRQGLLQRDGNVVATDGTSPLTFNVSPGNYYLAVRHRNHLGAMTAGVIALSTTTTTVNFQATTLPIYGTNALTTIGAVRLLWSGNALRDTILKYTGTSNDRDPILTRIGGTIPTNTVSGYFPEDVNMDGVVKYTGNSNDRDPVLVNIGATIPTGSRLEQLP